MNRRQALDQFQLLAGAATLGSLLGRHLPGLAAAPLFQLENRDQLVLGADRGQVALTDSTGKVTWKFPLNAEVHDLTLLAPNRILLPVARDRVAEVDTTGKVLWSYKAEKVPENKQRIEIHAVQRLKDGTTRVAESGNRRLAIVDPDGKLMRAIPLTINNPDPHRDTRLVRATPQDTYLVCHEGDGTVREYDLSGKVVWSHKLDLAGRPRSGGHGPEGHGTEVYGAWRSPKETTWIACGNGNRVLEVDKAGKTVWSLEQKEIPGIILAWVTTLHLLPSGNVVVGNCHAGADQPQLFEVTRDKKLVWQFNNQSTFGNGLAATQVLNLPEGTIR